MAKGQSCCALGMVMSTSSEECPLSSMTAEFKDLRDGNEVAPVLAVTQALSDLIGCEDWRSSGLNPSAELR